EEVRERHGFGAAMRARRVHEVEALFDQRDERRNGLDRVRVVAVERDHHVAAGVAHGAVHGRAVPARRQLLEDAAAELLGDLGGAVAARVDDEYLRVGGDAADVADDLCHGALLVHRDHRYRQLHLCAASKIIWNASIPGHTRANADSIGWTVFRYSL